MKGKQVEQVAQRKSKKIQTNKRLYKGSEKNVQSERIEMLKSKLKKRWEKDLDKEPKYKFLRRDASFKMGQYINIESCQRATLTQCLTFTGKKTKKVLWQIVWVKSVYCSTKLMTLSYHTSKKRLHFST